MFIWVRHLDVIYFANTLEANTIFDIYYKAEDKLRFACSVWPQLAPLTNPWKNVPLKRCSFEKMTSFSGQSGQKHWNIEYGYWKGGSRYWGEEKRQKRAREKHQEAKWKFWLWSNEKRFWEQYWGEKGAWRNHSPRQFSAFDIGSSFLSVGEYQYYNVASFDHFCFLLSPMSWVSTLYLVIIISSFHWTFQSDKSNFLFIRSTTKIISLLVVSSQQITLWSS